jgi:thioredoxin 1
MNNKIVIIAGCIALAMGTYFFILSKPPTEINTQMTPTSTETVETTTQPSTARYQPYTKAGFDKAVTHKRVYFFHAPWCPTCAPADRAFQANQASIPEDVVLFKTDYDSSDALKKQYAITYQHTFVLVDENGAEVKKWNGGGLEELITNTQ